MNEYQEIQNEENFEVVSPSAAKSHIGMWETSVPPDFCEETIDLFENSSEFHESVDSQIERCTQLNLLSPDLIEKTPRWKEVSYYVLQRVQSYSEMYRQHYNVNFFPEEAINESLYMKKYSVGESVNYHSHTFFLENHKRFLTIKFFLNTAEDGQYVLPEHNVGIEPMVGRCLIHPPFWTHPTYQTESTSDIYCISTFLQYR